MSLIPNPNFNSALPESATNQRMIFETPQVINPQTGQLSTGGYATPAISPSLLAPVMPYDLPNPPTDTNNYGGIIASGKALTDYFNSLKTTEPTDLTKMMKDLYAESGIEPLQTKSLESQKQLDILNAQMAALTAEAQAAPIRLQEEATGRAITKAGLAPIEAGELRKIALRSLPLQGQILAQQAVTTGDQRALAAAQQKLDIMFKLKSEDADRQYDYTKELRNRVYEYATTKEKEKLTQLQTESDRKYQESKDNLSLAQSLTKQAIENNQSYLITQISQLDENSPNFREDLARLQTQIKPKEDLTYKVLPDGRAVMMDKQGNISKVISEPPTPTIPEPGKETITGISDITGKPLTEGERLSQGYANRATAASQVINEIGSQFTGFGAYFGQFLPNILKSSDRQRFEQAQRDFVNAILRKESGAAIAESEFESAREQYFPQPGDKPAVIEQKARNRQTTINTLQLAGGVMKQPISGTTSSGLNYTITK